MRTKYILLLIILQTLGCREKFPMGVKNYEQQMVVEGLITNEPSPYTINLYLSTPVNDKRIVPYSGCKVTIFDNTGYSELLTEKNSGSYSTSETGIKGTIGNKYSISIITPDGKSYSSEFQEMREAIGIDSVYAEVAYQEKTDWPYQLPGYQFYVDTKTATNNSYFLWNLTETYSYHADYVLYDIQGTGGYWDVREYGKNYNCWKTEKIHNIFIRSTIDLSVPKITHQPLHFVGTDTKKVLDLYSLLVQQYSIDKEAFYFWKNIQEQGYDANFLIAKQPYNINGNIKNIKDQSEPVLGYFTVASVTQKRIFVRRCPAKVYYQDCYANTNLIDIDKEQGPIFLVIYNGALARVSQGCIDCTIEGGVTTRPSFWNDK